MRKPAYFIPITAIPFKPIHEHIDKDELVGENRSFTLRTDPLLDLETLRKAARAFGEEGRRRAFEYLQRLRSKTAAETLGASTGHSDEYLAAVREELGSDAAKVKDIGAFPDIDPQVMKALIRNGITDSRLCYLRLRDRQRRRSFSSRNHLDFGELEKAFAMTEIFQILAVSPTLASLLVRCGIGSVGELAGQDPTSLLARLKQTAAKIHRALPYNETDAKDIVLFAKTWVIARGED